MLKNNVVRMLDAKKIPYTLYQLPNDKKLSALETAKSIGVSPDIVFKTIVVLRVRPGKHILAVVPATHQVDLKAIATLIGEKKVMITTQDNAERLTGLLTGGISPLALINRGFQVILDISAKSHQEIHISAGERGLNIRLPVESLITLTDAQVGDISFKNDRVEDLIQP